MEPMKPMTPMEPMTPLTGADPWWPGDLGQPSSSGGQNDMHYAFFPGRHRLLVKQDGRVTTYDSGNHQVSGVSQHSGSKGLEFTSQDGVMDLSKLKIV